MIAAIVDRRGDWRALSTWRLVGLSIVLGAVAAWQETSDLYRATAIVTGTDMRSRPTGFAQCLREVLVKVSGEPRLYDNPRTAELARHADALVLSFDYVDPIAGIRPHDDQGTYDRSHDLTVHFDPGRVDEALAELGERPWRGERPVIVPVLVVRGFGPPFTQTYLLSDENPSGAVQRASFAEAARELGLKLRFPTASELAAWGVTTDGFPSPPQTASAPGEALVGTLEWQPDRLGWVGSWRMRWQGVDYAWQISGVNFDKAFATIARGVARLASGHGTPD